jgi:membrane-associated PAP2 superfamily phosphatase
MTSHPIAPAVRFYFWHTVPALIAAVAALLIFQFTDLDLWLSDIFYDQRAHGFPLRNAWPLTVVLHEWAKYLVVLVGLAALTGFIASFSVPALRAHRRALLFMFLSMTLSAAAVSSLRHVSNQHCPSDLSIYGGYAPYRHLLDPMTPDVKPGECSPSRHAAGGFGLMALYFAWGWQRPRLILTTGLAYGFVLGVGRLLQGAVFFSYILWAAIAVWLVMLALDALIMHRARVTARAGVGTLANG